MRTKKEKRKNRKSRKTTQATNRQNTYTQTHARAVQQKKKEAAKAWDQKPKMKGPYTVGHDAGLYPAGLPVKYGVKIWIEDGEQ